MSMQAIQDFFSALQLNIFGKIVVILAAVAIVVGIYFLITAFVPLVPRKYKKTVKEYDAKGKKRATAASGLETSLQGLSKKMSKHIHMTAIERSEMNKALRLSDMTETPEEYKAYMLFSALVFFIMALFIFLLGFLIPVEGMFKTGTRVIAVMLVVVGIVMYFYNKRKINKRKQQAIIEIERELPRFVSYLSNAFATEESSVLSILEHYTSYEARFGAELKMTIVDAKSGGFDRAMAALDTRCNSDQLKMVTHGLSAANRGDDVVYYFNMLERDFSAFEVAALRKNIKTIPQQLRVPKLLMMISVFAALFYPIIMSVVESIKLFFT